MTARERPDCGVSTDPDTPEFICGYLFIVARMRRVQIAESLEYGGLMFVYFLGVVVIGGGGIALGAAVGWNAATIRGTGGNPVVYDAPELAVGAVLVALGGSVLFTGLFGFVHKLIADSTAEGVANGSGPRGSEVTAGATPGRGGQEASQGFRAADDPGSGPTAEPEKSGADGGAFERRTAGQIAFGANVSAGESADEDPDDHSGDRSE